jgi:hypothetical protein
MPTPHAAAASRTAAECAAALALPAVPVPSAAAGTAAAASAAAANIAWDLQLPQPLCVALEACLSCSSVNFGSANGRLLNGKLWCAWVVPTYTLRLCAHDRDDTQLGTSKSCSVELDRLLTRASDRLGNCESASISNLPMTKGTGTAPGPKLQRYSGRYCSRKAA